MFLWLKSVYYEHCYYGKAMNYSFNLLILKRSCMSKTFRGRRTAEIWVRYLFCARGCVFKKRQTRTIASIRELSSGLRNKLRNFPYIVLRASLGTSLKKLFSLRKLTAVINRFSQSMRKCPLSFKSQASENNLTAGIFTDSYPCASIQLLDAKVLHI